MKEKTNGETIYLGEISREEINRVSSFFDQSWAVTKLGLGVLIRCESGRRTWQIADGDAIVRVIGGECNFQGTYLLSYQFVVNCRPFYLRNERVRFSIVDQEITSTSDSGMFKMRCKHVDTVFQSIDQRQVITAQLHAHRLYQIVDTTTYLQRDMPGLVILADPEMEHSPTTTTTSITVDQDSIMLHTAWTEYGLDDVTATVTAKTTGKGTISVLTRTLNRMRMAIGLLDNPEFTVSFDPYLGDFVVFSTSSLSVAIRRTPTTIHV